MAAIPNAIQLSQGCVRRTRNLYSRVKDEMYLHEYLDSTLRAIFVIRYVHTRLNNRLNPSKSFKTVNLAISTIQKPCVIGLPEEQHLH